MTRDFVPLDGNAAAGRIGQLFAFDVTRAIVNCGGCQHQGPFAELVLFGGGAGLILRCRQCGEVNIRMLETGQVSHFDLSGVTRISIRMG
jgi:hypothetical protein